MRKLIFLLFVTGTLINACSKKNTINVVEKNFEDEVPLNGNLVFIFDQELVSDTLLNYWDTTAYFTFQPAILGRFSWRATNELVFSPLKQLSPATAYQATMTKELSKEMPQLKLGKEKDFNFHTPYLVLENLNAYWAAEDASSSQARLYLNASFNYEINPKELRDVLSVEIEGQTQSLELVEENISPEVSFFLPDFKAEDKEWSANVLLKAGLKPMGGSLAMAEYQSEALQIGSPFKLNIGEITSDHDGVQGMIEVNTSQPVAKNDLKKFLTLTPEVDYQIEIEAQRFTITSEDFDVTKTYELVVKKGLKGQLGGELKFESSQQLSFGQLDPSIRFVDNKAVYLSGKGNRNIEASIINVAEVLVTITKVYQNNILSFINSGDYYYNYDYDDYYYDYNYYNVSTLGDVVWQEELLTRDLPRKGSSRLLHLDFEDKIGNYNGLYIIEVSSKDESYRRAHKLVAISDIGLIAKEGKNSLTIFANSIKTAQPLPNLAVSLIGKNNQILTDIQTDANGVAVYDFTNLVAPGFRPELVVAGYQDDFNYLPFSKTKISDSRFEVGGQRNNLAGYNAFIHGDRDIYRPGETINLSAIVRNHQWEQPGKIPVKLTLVAPNGREFRSVKKTLDSQGSFEVSIDLPPAALTGTYLAQVYTSNDVLMNTKSIAVEEFVPDRIKVAVKSDQEDYKVGETAELEVTATNFFGPPAANRNYEVELSLRKRYFSSDQNPDYNYSIEGTNQSISKVMRDGETDGQGQASERFLLAESYQNMGILQADFFVTVFDETGRPVNRRHTADVFTQEIFYGINQPGYYNKVGQRMELPIIAVDRSGKTLTGAEAQVKIIKHEFKTVLSKSGSYFRYRSEKQEKVLMNKMIALANGKQTIAFTPELSGRYEIKVSAPGVNTYVSQTFYAYGWGSTSYSSFQVNNEGRIDIELDKKQYTVGDQAKVIFKTPFSGRLLVTVESDKVLDHFYLDTDKRSASLELPIQADQVPNVYLTATLLRPHQVTDLPLTVAHGFVPVMVENPKNKLPIELEAPTASRSKTKQTIKVKTEPNTSVTLAVVDEGILQLTNYQTPDPHNFFYSKKALEVNTYDVYPYLFPEISLQTSTPGGDGMNLEKRVNPLTNERIKLVAMWSGIMTTDSRGEATYDIEVPQFSGDLRIMAVSYKDQAFASTHTNMKVADPVVISTALPRFFSPKDTINVPVVLSNTTKKDAPAKASIKISGPATLIGQAEQSTNIPAESEQVVNYRVVAQPEIGAAKISVEVNAMGERFTEVTDITIRPSSPLLKVSGSGNLKAGSKGNISMETESFIASSVDKKLVISKSPLVAFTDDLSYLLYYPYGCLEQTVSRAFPQIYYQDLAKDLLNRPGQNNNPNYHVQQAINRVMLMQLYNGGMTYWPGQGFENWWASAYAAHFLVEAQKAGFEVDPTLLDKLLGYLKGKLKDRRTVDYYYNGTLKRKIAPQEVAYSLYVLALANKPQKSTMNYYRARTGQLSLEARYLLAGAYALIGDQTRYQEVLPKSFEGEKANTSFGGSFYSYVRDEAIALNTLLEVDPENIQIPVMAKHVSENLKNRRWLNTQERSFSFLAMGKIARKANQSDIQATITLDGKKIADFDNKDITLTTTQLNGQNIEVSSSGTGQVYYFWEAEGISKDGSYKEEDSYMKVRKRFFSRDGIPLTNRRFKQNDLIVVQLSIEGSHNTSIENVVISDILPAGFEIENPRIGEVAEFNWIKDKSYPVYQDFRDDRINLFVTVNKPVKRYYYVVRAVSRGVYQMGPVGADAMYNGEYH
ncbi:MAG: alpha-2-macroglobulin family protein, partial [Cyclobacteriaceae bacterium]